MKQRPPRIFTDPEKISKHLNCSICHEVFDDPNRLGCGHTFCYVCIEYWASMSKLCPLCKKSLKHRKPQKDLIAASLVDQLQTQCSHQKCEWTDVYCLLKRHQRTCEHRERKTFESRNFDEIVDLHDDSEMKESVEINKKGSKKHKQQQKDSIPAFPSSPQLQSMSLHQTSPRIINLPLVEEIIGDSTILLNNATQLLNKNNSNQGNLSGSSNNSSYPDIKLDVLISNRINQTSNNQRYKNENRNLQSSQFKVRFSDFMENQFKNQQKPRINGINGSQSLNSLKNQQRELQFYQQNQMISDEIQQQMSKRIIDLPRINECQLTSNPFIIVNRQKEQIAGRRQYMKNPTNAWGSVHIKQKRQEKKQQRRKRSSSDSQSDSQKMSNPFDEPVAARRRSQKSKKKCIIVIDSQQSKINESRQSGEMIIQQQRNTNQNNQAPNYSLIEQQMEKQIEKEKNQNQNILKRIQIKTQLKQLLTYQPEIQYRDRLIKRNGRREIFHS